MRIMAISTSHDASVSIVEDGKLIYYRMAERITRTKHDDNVESLLTELLKFNNLFFDALIVLNNNGSQLLSKKNYEMFDFLYHSFGTNNLIITYTNHHLFHAYLSYYASNFKSAICVIVDGKGNILDENYYRFANNFQTYDKLYVEKESIFFFDDKFKNIILKNYYEYHKSETLRHERDLYLVNRFGIESKIDENIGVNYKKYNNFHVYDVNHPGIAESFEFVSTYLKISNLKSASSLLSAPGKVMGLSQYKNYESRLKYPYNSDFWKKGVTLANLTQKITQKRMIDLIKYGMNEAKTNNVILSGGYALNCVANYQYLKEIPNINLHIDSIPFDAGQSIGAAYYYHKLFSKDIPIQKLEDVYIGHKEDNYDLSNKFNNKKTNYEDIVDLLIQGEIVCIFQGQSEAGQRALGNRSMLFDPRIKNGKDVVNHIKKRESFRPFAGTILLEHVDDWFDMRGLKESPYMQFAVDTKKDKIDLIPAVVHVDGTCRIQTVTEKQNFHLYNLIKVFYNKTNVPILLNTSFNLAGDPLVETLEHAYETLDRSELKYLYLPEIETLIYK